MDAGSLANHVNFAVLEEPCCRGVGAVLGFVPQMLVLFVLLAVLEDVGYMARIGSW